MMVEPFRYKEVKENEDRQLAVENRDKLIALNRRLHTELDKLIKMCVDALKLSMPSSPKRFTVGDIAWKVSRRFIGWKNIGSMYYHSVTNPTIDTIRKLASNRKVLLDSAKCKELAEASLRILSEIARSDLLEDIVLSSAPFRVRHVYSWEEFDEKCGSTMSLVCYVSPWRYSVVTTGLYPAGHQIHSPSAIIGVNPQLVFHAYFYLDLFPLYNSLLSNCMRIMHKRLESFEQLKKRLKKELAVVKKFVTLSIL